AGEGYSRDGVAARQAANREGGGAERQHLPVSLALVSGGDDQRALADGQRAGLVSDGVVAKTGALSGAGRDAVAALSRRRDCTIAHQGHSGDSVTGGQATHSEGGGAERQRLTI